MENQIRGCIYGGALGDAYGSAAEGRASSESFTLESIDAPRMTDDTQLTLATCEALSVSTGSIPEQIAASFADWYQQGKVTGMGSSTLKALRDLSMGGAWTIFRRSWRDERRQCVSLPSPFSKSIPMILGF